MSAEQYLFIANALVWVGVAGYIAFLGSRTLGLSRRVQQLELLGDGDDE
ncbi:CcmD family protein [Salidesulfovibrio brasiliensis]